MPKAETKISALEDPELLRAVLAKVVPEGIQDNLVPITLDTQYHQAVAVTSQQRALNMSSYASQVIRAHLSPRLHHVLHRRPGDRSTTQTRWARPISSRRGP